MKLLGILVGIYISTSSCFSQNHRKPYCSVELEIPERNFQFKICDFDQKDAPHKTINHRSPIFLYPEIMRACAQQFVSPRLVVKKLLFVVGTSQSRPESEELFQEVNLIFNISNEDPSYTVLIHPKHLNVTEYSSKSLNEVAYEKTAVSDFLEGSSSLHSRVFEVTKKSCDILLDSVIERGFNTELALLILLTLIIVVMEVVFCILWIWRFSLRRRKSQSADTDRRSMRRSMIDPYRDQLEDINRTSIQDSSKYILSRTEVSIASPDPVGPVRLQSVVQV